MSKKFCPAFDKYRIYRECSRKRGYATTKAVNQDIRKARQKNPRVKLDYYLCDYCGKYHLTSHFVKNKF